jgi:PAS domain S-box-containing protein
MEVAMNDRPSAPQNRDAIKIAGLYLLLGSLWILFSDQLALLLTRDPALLSRISLFKGWGFIIVTALLLYWLIRGRNAGLRESEARYRSLFQNNHTVMLLIDPANGDIVDANPAACAFYGYSHPEIIRLKITDINQLTPERAFVETERTGQEQHRQFFLANGDVREVEVYSGPIEFISKTLLYSIVHDVTERKRAEEALRLSEENFVRAFNSSPAALAITRLADGKFLSVNEAYTRIMGYQPAEILGRTPAEMNIYVNPDERNVLVRQLREQGRVQNYELLVRDKSGEVRSLLVSMEPTLYNHEETIISTFLDMTERKRVEADLHRAMEELKRSNADLEQFAYVASHDLQEPLRAVAGTVQLLQKRYGGQLDERADEFIRHAVEGAARMQTLINDLLAYSRVGTRGQPFQPVDCAGVLADALTNLTVAIRESGAVITYNNLPTVVADQTQLAQLFQNLIGNAIKFRSSHVPDIQIGAERREGEWLFAVADNGIGLEAEYYERIFGVFQRLHTRREYSGTGIGLALCKKIVERHGGRIWVESQPGQGSTFYFTLPERENSHQ